MNTIVTNFILSHGILDVYNANLYNITYTSYIFNYILLIICIEYLIIYLKELYIFIFLLLSAIHFSFDIFYLTNLNFKSDLENNSEIKLKIISINNSKRDFFISDIELLKSNVGYLIITS